jgi:manganese/zinc/iron transport system permease protein
MTSLVPTGIDWPAWIEVWRVLTFAAGFNTSVVMIGVTLLGTAAGIVGTFAVLRKRALMGDALSHATLPGIACAFLVAVALGAQGRSLPVLLFGAAVSGVVAVLVVQGIVRHTRLPEDAAIGAVLSVFFGLGLVLLSYIQNLGSGDQGGIAKFIYGQTATMRVSDALTIGLVALTVIAAAAALFKEFRLVCFDQEFAGTQGWPISAIDLLMMALVVLVTVIGLQAVGLILIVALVIIPPAAARFWTDRLWLMTVAAALIGGASGYLGAAASALFPRFPAGGVIVLVAGAVFVLSLLFAPARGILFSAARHARLRLDIAEQHILRALFEAEERGERGGLDLGAMARARDESRLSVSLLARLMAARKLLVRDGPRMALTETGRREAFRVTRNHRLWEQFLIAYADLAPSHVDRSADYVEHVLSADMVARLERRLAAIDRLPRPLAMPESPHPLGSGESLGQEGTA